MRVKHTHLADQSVVLCLSFNLTLSEDGELSKTWAPVREIPVTKEFCPDLKATILIPSFSYPPKMYRCLDVILILNSYYLKLPFPVKNPVAFSMLTVLCNDDLN